MHHTPDTLTADMILRTPMGGMPDTTAMTPDAAAATIAAYVCEWHNANETTDAMHDDADAALRSIMVGKLTSTNWGADIIDAAFDECVYASWMIGYSRGTTGNGEQTQAIRIECENPINETPPMIDRTLTRADIARATAAIWNGQHGSGYVREYIADAIRDHDAGCIDADAADAIVQVAAFGEIIYG